MSDYLNDAWNSLFKKYSILEKVTMNGSFIISADMIREFREPRLMTKFDYSESMPTVFQNNKLSIMPIKRNEYIISNHQMFHRLNSTIMSLDQVNLPKYIASIDSKNITSEAIALNCSYITGILEDFTGDIHIYPTVSGRMSSKSFEFGIKNGLTKNQDVVQVDNSQIEIDGAYEGEKYLTLVEAKKSINKDFLIRQLYYPLRLWTDKINKPIKVVFLTHSNSIFSLYEYKFRDLDDYNSLELTKTKHYSLEDVIIKKEDVMQIINKIKLVNEPKVPFPQADDMRKVINLCEVLQTEPLSIREITDEYDFVVRQANYYSDAAMYLGLVKKSTRDKEIIYELTNMGKDMLALPFIQRQLFLVERILEHKVFFEALNKSLELARQLSTSEIVDIMLNNDLYELGKKIRQDGIVSSTYPRRASTIKQWLLWIDLIVYK